MIFYQKCLYFLAPVLLIICLNGQCFGQIDPELESKLAKKFAESAEELNLGDGIRVRGHQIGGGKFQPCTGDPIDMGKNKPKPSNPCPTSPGTHKLRMKRIFVISFDQEKRTMKVRVGGGLEEEIFIPQSIQVVNDGGDLVPLTTFSFDGSPENQVITVLYFISGRAEAILVGSR